MACASRGVPFIARRGCVSLTTDRPQQIPMPSGPVNFEAFEPGERCIAGSPRGTTLLGCVLSDWRS